MKEIIITSCAILLNSCSPTEQKRIISTYENGQVEQERVFVNGKNNSLNYMLKQYHSDGSIEMIGEIKNGKQDGVFYWFYPNGNKKWVEKYVNGKSVDTTFCFYESGKLKRKAITLNYNRIKQATEYYESGEIKIESFINDGSYIDSLWVGYYKNGIIKESGRVMKGKKIGVWKYFNNKGILLDSVDQSSQTKIVFDFEEEELKEKIQK